MKTLLILLLLIPVLAGAEPFLVCDPQADVTQYRLEWAGGATEDVNAEADGSIRYDVVSVAVGDNSGNIYAGKPYEIDGVPQEGYEWSDPSPFVLGRPSKPSSVTNIRLIK